MEADIMTHPGDETMKALRMHTRTEVVAETPLGWLNKTTGRYHKTAALAAKAIDRRSRAIANGKGAFNASAVVVEWEPRTEVGRMVVEVLNV